MDQNGIHLIQNNVEEGDKREKPWAEAVRKMRVMVENSQAWQAKWLIFLNVQFTVLCRHQQSEQNNEYVFAITGRKGEIKLNTFVLEDLILYIMVKSIGFDKHGDHEPKSIETDVLFQKNYTGEPLP